MSYAGIVAALQTAFAAVSGIKYVLDYEPKAAQDVPMMYLLLDNVSRDREPGGQVTTTYDVLATLVLRWQDNEQAEQDLMDLLDGIMTALDDDPGLSGALNGGYALITGADAGYTDISGTKYRMVDFTVECEELTCV